MSNKFLIYIALVLSLTGGCMVFQTPLNNASRGDRLVPGLRVLYFDRKFSNVQQVPDNDRAMLQKGRPGTVLPMINHQFGQDEIFDSGRTREVGVQMTGYLHFDQKGSYEFQALSNDGVEVIIDGNSILIDPDVHSDRLSDIGTFTVKKAGWHALMVKYFQRKGSAAIKLYWKTPGKDVFEVVPEKVYGHLADDAKGK